MFLQIYNVDHDLTLVDLNCAKKSIAILSIRRYGTTRIALASKNLYIPRL